MLPCLLFTILAPPVGPYSGISVDNLLDTPILKSTPLLDLSAGELPLISNGLTPIEGQAGVYQAGDGFELTMTCELPAGRFVLLVECSAPDAGSDSFWVEVDGERQTRPMSIPRERMADARAGLAIDQQGEHTIKLLLREGPGATLRRVQVVQVKVAPGLPAVVPARAEHPRMLFSKDDIPKLQARAATELGQQCYQLAGQPGSKPPRYDPKRRTAGGYRSLAPFALAEVLEPDPARMERILLWLETSLEFDHWGIGSSADLDLDAEYMMEGVAFTYDWLYDRIPEDLRHRLRDNIAKHCDILYSASLAGHTGGGTAFQQNHFWFAHLALGMGAAAIWGEDPRAEEWLAWTWDRYERVFLTLGDDGGFHEGPGYYDYSMPTLFTMIGLYEGLSGHHIPYGDEGLAKSAAFRFQMFVPGLGETLPLEDTKLHHGRPARWVFEWLASRYHDPVTQGMAVKLTESPNSHYQQLLALDPDLQPVDPLTKLPTAYLYDDIDTAFARTAWGDSDATMLAFVSRPMGGEKYAALCAKYGIGGTGHNHPEQNHFILWAHGQLLATDPGYTYEKRTANHNTILVDGQGQYGDGEMWPSANAGRADIIGFTNDSDVTILTGEAAGSYPEALGLKRYERTIALLGQGLVVIHDTLQTAEGRTFQWRQNFQGEHADTADGATITVGNAQAVIHAAMPDGTTAKVAEHTPQFVHPTRDHTPENSTFQVLELTTPPLSDATFLVTEQLGAKGDTPAAPKVVRTAEYDAVSANGIVAIFNRTGQPVTVEGIMDAQVRCDTDTLVILPDGRRIEHRITRQK